VLRELELHAKDRACGRVSIGLVYSGDRPACLAAAVKVSNVHLAVNLLVRGKSEYGSHVSTKGFSAWESHSCSKPR
jgi:hypothetical protein